MKNLKILPRIDDSYSFLYIEHAKIDQEKSSISIHEAEGTTRIPIAKIMTLILGPGTSITHAAVKGLSEGGCSIIWSGAEAERFYTSGYSGNRKSQNILTQASLWADLDSRNKVAIKMYQKRFKEDITDYSIDELRGLEGFRMKKLYKELSEQYDVPWHGRNYTPGQVYESDQINQALTLTNQILYGIIHSAIESGGYSTAMGFIHTGYQLSFVYDISDLYKHTTSIPVSFKTVKTPGDDFYQSLRINMRESLKEQKILTSIIPDIKDVFDI